MKIIRKGEKLEFITILSETSTSKWNTNVKDKKGIKRYIKKFLK